jgi:hypothetical protein
MNISDYARSRALQLAPTEPKEAFRLLLAADMGLDPSQEDLFDALLVVAENDGDAYRKRDAVLAVSNAWKEWKKETDQNLREDFRAIQKKLEKALQAQWQLEERESKK